MAKAGYVTVRKGVMMHIQMETLHRLRACQDQVALFKRLFPSGVEITTEALDLAFEHKLDVGWLVSNPDCPADLRVEIFRLAWRIYGSVTVHEGATAPALAEVTGSVTVHEGATFTAPALAEVTGYVYVHKGVTFTAPALAEVTGSVYVHEGATFTAPALAEVIGSVYVHEGATFTAPALAKAGYVYVHEGATFTAPAIRDLWIV